MIENFLSYSPARKGRHPLKDDRNTGTNWIFCWNFGNIFFDSFTNNLWHKKKIYFLSHLNLFLPLRAYHSYIKKTRNFKSKKAAKAKNRVRHTAKKASVMTDFKLSNKFSLQKTVKKFLYGIICGSTATLPIFDILKWIALKKLTRTLQRSPSRESIIYGFDYIEK